MPQERSRLISLKQRMGTFQEVHLGLSQAEAVEDARLFLERERAVKGQGCPLTGDFFPILKLLAKKDIRGAALKLLESNPLAGVTSRCSPEMYQETQVYNRKARRISLRLIERFCADSARVDMLKPADFAARRKLKVAVIGSGPAGLMAAAFLVRQGFGVTIFDSAAFAGGSLGSFYPEFRLPRAVLDQLLAQLTSAGVEFRMNVLFPRIVSADNLCDDHGFSAILLATGAGISEPSGIKDDTAAGVLPAANVLLWTRAMRAGRGEYTTPPFLGHRVVVVGQNEMALDAARTAVRLGKKALLVVAGAETDIKVPAETLREAADEGVTFKAFTVPESVKTDASGCVQGLVCRHLDYRVDGAGRLTVAVEEAFEIEADTVLSACGMRANSLFLSEIPGLDFNLDGSVWVRADSSYTSVRKIFAAGHAVRASASLTEVLADARRAASEISAYLQG
jgi:glutamate synthase (NADPH/NADH) small chain